MTGNHYPYRGHLIDGCIRRVAAPRGLIEQHLTLKLTHQSSRESSRRLDSGIAKVCIILQGRHPPPSPAGRRLFAWSVSWQATSRLARRKHQALAFNG